MAFLRNKKSSKQTKQPTNPLNTTIDSTTTKESKSKFGRKKKNKSDSSASAATSSRSSELSQTTTEEEPVIGPLGANPIPAKGYIPPPSSNSTVGNVIISPPPRIGRAGASTTSSQTVSVTTTATTASTSNNSSSVSALFDNGVKRTNALQQRQISHMKRVGSTGVSVASSVSPVGRGVSPVGRPVGGRMQQPQQQPKLQQHQPKLQSPQPVGVRQFHQQNLKQQNKQQQQQQQQKFQQQQQQQQQPPQPQQIFQKQIFQQPQPQQPKPKPPVPPKLAPMPMTRSGWSVVSNASTAMNSTVYIESLNELPSSPGIRGKTFPVLNSQSDNQIRLSLSRPYGRSHLPPSFQPKWEISIDEPNWDPDEGRYKYKISLFRLPSVNRGGSSSTNSYNSATTNRSLQDFVWLEKALRAEYHGGLLVPLLSLALFFDTSEKDNEEGSVASKSIVSEDGSRKIPPDGNVTSTSIGYLEDKMDRNEMVNTAVLTNWLSDVFNGIRGEGELLLLSRGDVSESEAVEMFLFRHSELLKEPQKMGRGLNPCRASGLGSPFNLFSMWGNTENREDGCTRSLFENFLENPFSCFGSELASKNDVERQARCGPGVVSGMANCNSNVSHTSVMEDDFAGFQQSLAAIATHSELLEAERDLIASHIRCTTVALTRVHALARDEAYVGQCWKRLAISLSNLFSVEKDLETAHIGDQIKSSKKNQPFRKLRKTAVDDGLRILARGKIDRSKPSLAMLMSMLSAYYADLNSVVPAFKEYRDALTQLNELGEMSSLSSTNRGTWDSRQSKDWTSSFKALAKHLSGPGDSAERTLDSDATSEEGMYSLNTTQSKALQTRIFANERMLKYSITALCKACPLRTARMAWWYLKLEVKQASNVHAAATALRQTLSIDADTALAMRERHYEEDESKANDDEIKLVKRILELGANQGDDNIDYAEIEIRRQNALRMATQRVGRWDAETALAVMEAAGVEDAEVQMDETSRELRHVRKFAISLRENVVRCREAAEALAAFFIRSDDSHLQISRSRREFWAAISTVFSGRLISGEDQNGFPSSRVLAAVGISTNDKGGWLGHGDEAKPTNQRRRSCGEVARRYLKKRDNQANILISRVLKLLNEYEQRLEGIESFVYMHCVGIQLEKHCSKRRAKALSAWEKRTDISTAINVATKKRIPKLVQELKIKLDALPQVSHTTVIKAKESHLASKTLKSDLHKLANKRFGRAQEVSTERVIAIMSLWAKHEESVAIEEVRALGEAVQEVELSVESADVDIVVDKTLPPEGASAGVASEVRTPEGRSLLM